MSEEVLDPTASPPLPPGLGAAPGQTTTDTGNGGRRPPVLPIPRLPGQAQPASSTTSTAPPPPAASPTAPSTPGSTPSSAPAAGTPTPAAPAASATGAPAAVGAGTPTGSGTPAAGGSKDATSPSRDQDSGGRPGGADADAAPAAAKAAPPISAADALNIATSTLSPAMQAAMGLPATLAGLGSGLLAPFAQILSQFGQGSPAMPSTSGLPPAILDRLTSGDPSSAVTGEAGAAFQGTRDDLTNQSQAMDNLDRKLRTTLESSATNTTTGRQQIDQIINQVNSAIQAMSPILNTPAGQAAVVGAITTGLTAAGSVLTQALGKDGLNASTINNMASDYIKDLRGAPTATTSSASGEDRRTVLASATGDNPTAWAIKALAANGITDPRAIRNWLPGLLTMGKRESANNPRAVNLWDSNARAGIPSKGWMQTIEPTFNAHWRPGTSRNIFDPVANAAAAIHYVMTRYGVSADGSNLMARVQQANPYAPPKGY